jgi:hypothetical protein
MIENATPNTYWRPIFWEPVAGTGERLMVGVVARFDGQVSARRILRDDVLDCLYGKAGRGARVLIDTGLEALRQLGAIGVFTDDMPAAFGLEPGPLRHTYAESLGDALRDAALLYSSLASLAKLDELEESDAPAQEEVNRRFATEVRERVAARRPDLDAYFGRGAMLIEGGEPTRFGFCSPRAILHFGVLSPVRQPSGLRDARARLWELHRARELAGIPLAGLVFATPRADDPTLSGKQVESVRRILAEIEREADSYRMRFMPVTSADEGAERVIEYA